MAESSGGTLLTPEEFAQIGALVWPPSANVAEVTHIQRPWFQGFDFFDKDPYRCFFVQESNGEFTPG